VPVATPTHCYGLLAFVDKLGPGEFAPEDEGLALAEQLALAYEAAQRQAEIQRHSARLEREVLERERAETTLRESEGRFRQLAENIRDVFWLIDAESQRVLYVSPAYEEIWGRSRASLYEDGGSWTEAISPQDRDRVVAAARDRAPQGKCDEEYRIRRPDGTERWIRHRAFPVSSEPRMPRRIAAIAEDITDRKRAEQRLARFAERLAILRQIDRAIRAAHRPRELASAALQHLGQLIPCWQIAIWVFDWSAETAELLAGEGAGVPFFPPGTKVPVDAFGAGDLAALRAVQDRVVEDIELLPEPSAIVRTLQPAGLRSYAGLPLTSEGQVIGSLVLGSDCAGAFDPEQIEIARQVAGQLAIAIRHALLFHEVRLARKRLETLSRQLLKAHEEERRRIARELHDEIGQSLTAVRINLQRAMSGADLQSSRPYLNESSGLIERVLQQVRDISLDLRPSVLDDLGLVASLRWYLDRTSRRAGFVGQLSADPGEIRLPSEVETACFRIVQEAVTNIVRHAGARRVEIGLLEAGEHLEVVVRDDGAGFDVTAARECAVRGGSLGLLGMQERVALLGGRIAIESGPGRGTEVQIRLPRALPESAPDSGGEEDP
jgi:PAS domain S-box-containing protein